MDEIRPLAIPKQISTISMHITSLMKIYLCYRPEMKMRTGNGQTTLSKIDEIWHQNPKADLHNIDVHTKFGENSLIFT